MRVSTAERNRWSDYAQGARSRSSSVGHGLAESDAGSPALRGTPSFDRAWEAVDERDEMGLTSEDETDDDVLLDDEDEDDEEQEEATSAMMIAEEGRGIIVKGGDGPIIQLHVKPGMRTFPKNPLVGCSYPTLFYRHHSSPCWVFKYPEPCALVPGEHYTTNCNFATCT